MSVTVTQKLTQEIYYPDIGVTVPAGSVEVDVTYTVSGISSFDGTNVTAIFQVEISGEKSQSPYAFTFPYSGSGNPLDGAESALKGSMD